MDENNNKYKEALMLACNELAAITRNQYGEDDSYINTDGKKIQYVDYIVSVIGKGNINFYTKQSGL